MLTITDIYGNEEAITGFKLLKRMRNVSGEKTLAFLLLPTEQNAHSFNMVQEESIVEFGVDTYRIKQVSEKNTGKTFYKEVVAIHTFFDLIDDHNYNLHTGSLTFQNALQFVFGGSGYTWAVIDTFYAQDFENFGDDNRLALFQKVLQRYGAEFTLNGTHLTFKRKIGNATDFQFRYSYNIKTITRNVNTNNLSTYIKGYGKQNEDGTYVVQSEYTSPNAAVFGIRHAKPVRDENYTTLVGLNERLVAELIDKPELSITLDFVDLRRAGYPYDVPNEGDDVFLIYEPMGIDLEARIMDITEEFTEFGDYPIKTDVTLANYRNNMTDQFVDFSRTSKTVNDIVEGNHKLPYNVLDDAVKRATEALQSAQTELEFENGIIARSKDNPNHLTLYNSAGLGISLDGGITFEEAITYLGINTKLLTAGQINANNISVRGGGETDYSLIDARGFYAKGTAFAVERPDGFVLIQDGIANFDLNVQSGAPQYKDDTTYASGDEVVFIKGPYAYTHSTAFMRFDYLGFKWTSRYLNVQLYGSSGGQGQGIYVQIENASRNVLGSAFTTSGTEVFLPITIDLGVPTGEYRHLYIWFRSTSTSHDAKLRMGTKYLSG